MHRLLPLLPIAFTFGLTGISNAAVTANVEYIFSGSAASGTLNGVPFDSTFQITLLANTGNITAPNPYAPQVPAIGASINIDGLGTYDIYNPLTVFSTFNYSGFYHSDGGQWALMLFYQNPGGIIDLSVPQTAVATNAAMVQWNYDNGVTTSGGRLSFTGNAGPATFQTILIPEPSTWLLSSVALLGLAGRRRRATW